MNMLSQVHNMFSKCIKDLDIIMLNHNQMFALYIFKVRGKENST